MGIRLSLPKFFEVTFIPGADCLRLYSFLSTNLITSLTVFLSCPWLIISLILLSFSTYAFRIESNFEYSGKESWSVWSSRNSALGGLLRIDCGIVFFSDKEFLYLASLYTFVLYF